MLTTSKKRQNIKRSLTPSVRIRADGVPMYKDFSAYNREKLIAEMDYYWSEEDQRDWKLPDTIRYYKKLAEIAGRAHRELTNDDFEAFCGTFDMSENTDRRRHMFELFAAFDVGFVRTKKSDFFV